MQELQVPGGASLGGGITASEARAAGDGEVPRQGESHRHPGADERVAGTQPATPFLWEATLMSRLPEPGEPGDGGLLLCTPPATHATRLQGSGVEAGSRADEAASLAPRSQQLSRMQAQSLLGSLWRLFFSPHESWFQRKHS